MGMYSLATGLSTFNNRSAIKVRVIRSYLVREKKGSADLKSQELVLHDPEIYFDIRGLEENTMDILKIASKELGFYTLQSFIKDIID
nr:replication protein A 70 kDa DNA-binding subunit D-like [Ipomoea batatas]